MASPDTPDLIEKAENMEDAELAHHGNMRMSPEKKIEQFSENGKLKSSSDDVSQTPVKNFHTSRENVQHT